ncbi:hypothetical protein AC579_2505 [Pseudocercospora musae]|uniref:RING-type domain-containing protein n=1 Tax=Pseudocercospora musae TaxID=113226 RepID=A0A139I4D5_9PEZI|nr:hypothetical protein AC579_2505 [Pseudocercospora musae]
MAASSASRATQPPTVIDLVSSDDEDDAHVAPTPTPTQLPTMPAPPTRRANPPHQLDAPIIINHNHDYARLNRNHHDHDQLAPLKQEPSSTPPPPRRHGGQFVLVDGEEVFIPDTPEPAPEALRPTPSAHSRLQPQTAMDEEVAWAMSDFTADSCLQRILGIFPDVSHEYVLNLYGETEATHSGTQDASSKFERIVEKVISTDYPKQAKGKQVLKRKREDDDAENDAKRWTPDRVAVPSQHKAIQNIIKADFPEFRMADIIQSLKQHKHLLQTYVAVANIKDKNDSTIPFRGRPSVSRADAETIATNSGFPALVDELRAARQQVLVHRDERALAQMREQVEEANLQQAIAAGETAECQACFEELPMNRQIHCNGELAHWTCFDCATTYIKTQIGDSRCEVLCTAGCGSGFAHAQLHLLEDKQLLGKLEQLQQEKDIRDAGLDDLEECPFCDYKAILPPVEEDFEFRCANPECEKVSCRRCKSVSHIPRSCEEHAKDNKLDSRHKIEEAMTAAMLRSCNKCKKQFIKDFGCNKMSCPSCGNLQCYVCSETIKDYNHFNEGPHGNRQGGQTLNGAKKCPLYDNVEERHEREVKEAEVAARAQILNDNPDVTEEDLQIKISERVKKADADRIKRARGALPGVYGAGAAGLFLADPIPLLGLDADDDDENGDARDDEDNDEALVRRPPDILAMRLQARARAAMARDVMQLRARMAALNRARPGLGGHIAGHGDQAHLARPPQPAHARGLAHRIPAQAQGPGHVLGLDAARFPRLQFGQPLAPAPAPAPLPAPQPAHQNLQANPFAHLGAGQILGARNNGLGGPQGLFDASAEDPFGGGDADPFGFARIAGAPQFNEMAFPQQDWDAAREQQRQALQNVHNRIGGTGQVRALDRDDPYRHNGYGFPGAPQAG